MNFAKEVKRITIIHYICNDCGIFGNGYKKTFASLANVRFHNVMFCTDFDSFRFSLIFSVLNE